MATSTSPLPRPLSNFPLPLLVCSALALLPSALSLLDYPELASSINPRLDPCQDFYKFVCDGFEKSANLRSECTEISNTATRKSLVQAQLQALLSGNARQEALAWAGNGPLGNLYQKMFSFHSACMEWPRKEMAGSEVVLAKLEALAGSGPSKGRQFNTEWAIRAFPIGAFFQLVPVIDTRKGRSHLERKIIGIRPKALISSQADWNSKGQGNNGLMSSRFGLIMHALLEDDIWRALRLNSQPVLFPFSNYILQGEVSSGCLRPNCPMSDRLIRMLFAEAERRVRNLLAVEQKLASNFDTDPLYESGPLALQSYVKLRQLDQFGAFSPAFNWTHFLGSLLWPIGRQVNGEMEVHVSEPGLLPRLAWLLGQLGGQQISDYLDWQVLWAFLPQLDPRFARPYVGVNKMKDSLGIKKCPLERRWMQIGEKCEKFVEWYFPHLLDRIYIRQHLGQGVREEVRQIYANVNAAFKEMLKNNSWLDSDTKQRAFAKLDWVQANAVYFDQIFDDAHLARMYRPYEALRLDVPFAQQVHQVEGFNFLRHFSTNDFYDPSWGVNAYYSRENNALVALNGYLQPPIYSPRFLAPLNYAGIGTTLGHELSHGFDDWGSYYNFEGRNEDWLGPAMPRAFHERKQCFAQQYGAVRVEVDGTSLAINGSLTVNENIADNGGLAAAFHAWQLLKRKAGNQAVLGQVKGLQQFNEDQLFFLHYAFRQCSRMGQVWLKQKLLVGQHSVVPARVNIPLQNFPQFAAVFHCPAGSAMNPTKKCTIW